MNILISDLAQQMAQIGVEIKNHSKSLAGVERVVKRFASH
jgi:hypothetical protein